MPIFLRRVAASQWCSQDYALEGPSDIQANNEIICVCVYVCVCVCVCVRACVRACVHV